MKKIKNHFIISALTVFLIMGLFSVSYVFAASWADVKVAESEELKYQDLFYYKLVDGKLHITRAVDDNHYNDNGELDFTDRCLITSLTIPDVLPVGGVSYPVEYIDGKVGSVDGAFGDCFNLTTLNLPSTLKEIGDNAFRGCTALTSVQLPAGLEKLGCGAFGGCSSLCKINIPKDCHSGDYAGEIMYDGPFANTESLTDVTIANGSTFIDSAMFDNSGIKEITIPDSVTWIGSNAFRNTRNLSSVNISNNSALERIGWTAFSGSGITSIYLPSTVNFVDVGAFAGCEKLKTVRMSENITCNDYQTERGYDTGIFNGCTSLTSIIFPEGIQRIGRCWFFDSPIESITIPSSVKEIEDSAFRYCLNLKTVTFEDGCSLETIGGTAFRKDSNLTEFSFPDSLIIIGANAFEETGLYTADLPDSLETMYQGAFNGCSNLETVTIPNRMTYEWGDNNGAFEGCNSLSTVIFKEGVTKIDNGLFGWNEGLESIEIPEGVTEIGRRAFRRNYNLKKIVLPKSLTSIGGEAFSDCTALETIEVKGTRPAVDDSICENVVATVKFGTWDLIPDNWGGQLTFEGTIGYYKLNFDANGGRTDTPYISVKRGEAYGKLPKASRKGYSFIGWYTEKEGGSKVTSKTILKSDEDKTVYAHWKGHKYNIKFNKNGGTGSMKKKAMKNLVYGRTYTLPANKFSRKGYVFIGWSDKKRGTIIYTNRAHIRNVTAKDKETVTLYAIWKKKNIKYYNINYDANGGTGKMKPDRFVFESVRKLKKNTFKRTGWTFVGWSKKENGTVQYIDQASVRKLTSKANGTVVLYAVWIKNNKTKKIKEIEKKTPKVYGLIIGGCNARVNNKDYYTKDEAIDVYKKLLKNKICGYKTSRGNIKKKLVENDEAPYRTDIDTWIPSAFASTSDNDISFVYYAGHGDGGGVNGKGRGICLRKSDGGAEYYSYEDFLSLLDKSIKGKVILIVDACYSEGFVIAAKKSPMKDRIAVFASSAIDETSQSDYKASQSNSPIEPILGMWEVLTRGNKGYHQFTYALMKGLNWRKTSKYPADLDNDRAVTCEELFAYINSNISASSEEKIQTPKCYLGNLKNQVIFSY